MSKVELLTALERHSASAHSSSIATPPGFAQHLTSSLLASSDKQADAPSLRRTSGLRLEGASMNRVQGLQRHVKPRLAPLSIHESPFQVFVWN
eukprot:1623320-Amphidinium_carterae.2